MIGKKQNNILIGDFFKNYKNKTKSKISRKHFTEIFSNFNKFCIEKVFEGEEIILIERNGTMRIRGKKPKIKIEENSIEGLPIDWKKTYAIRKKTGDETKTIYFTNEDTDGLVFKFFWSKKKIYTEHKNLFSFQATRFNKRLLNKIIKGGKEYV